MEKLTIQKCFTLICKEINLTKIELSAKLNQPSYFISSLGKGVGKTNLMYSQAILISDYFDSLGIWFEPLFFLKVCNGQVLEKDFKIEILMENV